MSVLSPQDFLKAMGYNCILKKSELLVLGFYNILEVFLLQGTNIP